MRTKHQSEKQAKSDQKNFAKHACLFIHQMDGIILPVFLFIIWRIFRRLMSAKYQLPLIVYSFVLICGLQCFPSLGAQ